MNKIKKIICIVLCVVLTSPAAMAFASEKENYWPELTEPIEADSAILLNADTGTILYEKKIDKKRYPASITKILTTLIAIENGNMEDTVVFSQDAVYKTEGSGIWRDVGEKMTLEQCLYAVMLESANECAYAVAEHVGGDYKTFIKMMNDRAKEIGCTNSHFENPHGLPDENHYVTARDMALIAQEAYKNEMFRTICGTERYTIPKTNKHKEPTYLQNHHKMLYPCEGVTQYLYDYCTGGKTGYTNAAGNTLVTYAEKDGMTLIAVVLKGTNPAYWIDTRTLLDFGFENFSTYNISENFNSENDELSKKYDTLNVNEPYAQIDANAKIIMPKTIEFKEASMKVNYANASDEILAQMDFTYNKHKIGTADILRTGSEIDEIGIVIDQTEESEAAQTEEETAQIEESASQKPQPAENQFQEILNQLVTSGKIWFILGAVLLLLLVVISIFVTYQKSHNFRRDLANRKNARMEQKRYPLIPDDKKKNRR